MNKVKAAEEFLKSLENHDVTTEIVTNRMDIQILYVINNYAKLISSVQRKEGVLEERRDIATSSMIIGYLLKSHLDRYELEQRLGSNE